MFISPRNVALIAGPAYAPETLALVARMTDPPPASRVILINNLIVALKSSGVWDDLEVFYILAAHDAQAARLNWKSTSYNLSAVGGPTFTTDRGYAGDGSTSYLNTGWSINTSTKFLQDSASFGAYCNVTNAPRGITLLGAIYTGAGFGYVLVNPQSATSTFKGALNLVGDEDYGAASGGTGFSAFSRTASNLTTGYKNGVPVGTSTTASTGRPARTFWICAANNGTISRPTADRIAMAFAGAGLTDAKMLALHTAVLTYLTAVGAN